MKNKFWVLEELALRWYTEMNGQDTDFIEERRDQLDKELQLLHRIQTDTIVFTGSLDDFEENLKGKCVYTFLSKEEYDDILRKARAFDVLSNCFANVN